MYCIGTAATTVILHGLRNLPKFSSVKAKVHEFPSKRVMHSISTLRSKLEHWKISGTPRWGHYLVEGNLVEGNYDLDSERLSMTATSS